MVKYTTKGMDNKAMNSDTYALRRKVIDIIYSAKRLIDLPRINVRITEPNKDYVNLGRARIGGDKIIWIPTNAFSLSDADLRQVVLHEVLHTVFNIRHKDSGIMTPKLKSGYTISQIDKMFLDEIKGVLN